jgi:hypothetical protein
MPSNLIPVQRVDKNGRTVTRHVRSASTPKASLASIPAPSITPERQKKLDIAKESIRAGILSSHQKSRIDEALATFSNEELDDIHTLMWEGERKDRPFMFGQIILSYENHRGKMKSAAVLLRGSSLPADMVPSFMNSLHRFPQFNAYEIHSLGEEDQKRVLVIADAVAKLRRMYKVDADHQNIHLKFRDPEIFSHIVGNPDRTDDIIDWYRKRRGPGGLDEMLNSFPALGEGAL